MREYMHLIIFSQKTQFFYLMPSSSFSIFISLQHRSTLLCCFISHRMMEPSIMTANSPATTLQIIRSDTRSCLTLDTRVTHNNKCKAHSCSLMAKVNVAQFTRFGLFLAAQQYVKQTCSNPNFNLGKAAIIYTFDSLPFSFFISTNVSVNVLFILLSYSHL